MVLNSSRLIAELTSRYCGMCWYLANSAAHAVGESGGRMPTTGSHSVIDSPDKVSRVTPPITTMTKIIPQQHSSQTAIGRKPPSNEPVLTNVPLMPAESALAGLFMAVRLTLETTRLACF